MEANPQNNKLTNEQKARLALKKILVTNLSKMTIEERQAINKDLTEKTKEQFGPAKR